MTRIGLLGMGPDGDRWLTRAGAAYLAGSDLLIGAARLLEAAGDHPAKKVAAVAALDIVAALEENRASVQAAVLLSGDTGFYSGARKLVEVLGAERITILPGISAHQLLCARLCVPWEDACLVSVHGREQDVLAAVLNHERTIVLTGSNMTPEAVCGALAAGGLGFVRIWVGTWLGYAEERIVSGTAEALAAQAFDPLSVLLVENERPLRPAAITPGLPDEAFLRGGAPMTKREVRAVSIAQLAPRAADVVWDVGAGTGSVAIECALLCRNGRVFAVERDADACQGIRENRGHFGAWHLRVVHGEAPGALAGLPAPDRVFIGGSGGSLPTILAAVKAANANVRVVVNAITLETLAEAMEAMQAQGYARVECTQVQASRARPVGAYHMMTAQNPVFIIAGGGI